MTTTTHASDNVLRDKNGRVRSKATLPGFRKGVKPGNYGKQYTVDRLTLQDVDTLICGRSRTSSSGLRDRAHIALLFCSGLRIQESLDLVPADITFEDNAYRVLVRCGKGGKMRRVGMLPMAGAHLDAWMSRRRKQGISDDAPLFCTIAQPSTGGPLGSPQIRTMLKRTAEMAGLDKRVTPHVFRHSLALYLDRIGTPLTVISRQLGHSNVGTTGIYLRWLSDDEMFDAMAAINVDHRDLSIHDQLRTASYGVKPDAIRRPEVAAPPARYGLTPDVVDLVRAAALEEAIS